MSLVTDALARSQKPGDDAVQRLQAMARSFARSARNPVIDGGCPIMNTAIEADDTHPDLRDRARESMTLWHRLIGRIVKDGIAAGTLRPDVDPYELASVLTSSLEGGLMLARLYDDPAHMDRVIAHVSTYVETLRADASPGAATNEEAK
jgi:AcrR family transcriptional regulator